MVLDRQRAVHCQPPFLLTTGTHLSLSSFLAFDVLALWFEVLETLRNYLLSVPDS